MLRNFPNTSSLNISGLTHLSAASVKNEHRSAVFGRKCAECVSPIASCSLGDALFGLISADENEGYRGYLYIF